MLVLPSNPPLAAAPHRCSLVEAGRRQQRTTIITVIGRRDCGQSPCAGYHLIAVRARLSRAQCKPLIGALCMKRVTTREFVHGTCTAADRAPADRAHRHWKQGVHAVRRSVGPLGHPSLYRRGYEPRRVRRRVAALLHYRSQCRPPVPRHLGM
jgi:hypothetical protein